MTVQKIQRRENRNPAEYARRERERRRTRWKRATAAAKRTFVSAEG